jgi:hypothetical protein
MRMSRRDQRKTVIHSWAELPACTSEVEEAEFWASHMLGERSGRCGSLHGPPADGGAALVHAEAMRSARAATASSPGTSGATRA